WARRPTGQAGRLFYPTQRLKMFLDAGKKVRILLDGLELRELLFDGVGGAEEETDVCGSEHGGVVERITRGNNVVIERAQGLHRFFFLIRNAQFVTRNLAVFDF